MLLSSSSRDERIVGNVRPFVAAFFGPAAKVTPMVATWFLR
jgi:hypothetical protein